jgi:hypothetical protein
MRDVEDGATILDQLLAGDGSSVEGILTAGGWQEVGDGGFDAPSHLDVIEYVEADGKLCVLRRDAILGLRRSNSGTTKRGPLMGMR